MNEPAKALDRKLMHNAMEIATRLFIVGALGVWCFLILQPFLMPLLWGVILAVALEPAIGKLAALFGGRRKLAIVAFTLIAMGALIVPALLTSESFFDGVRWLSHRLEQGYASIPPPPAQVAEWPLIGSWVSETWASASEDIDATLVHFGPQLKTLGTWLLGTLTGVAFGLIVTLISILIAALMLVHSEGGGRTARAIGTRIGGEAGREAIELSVRTIRSVATGVVGVAAIQAVLAAIGLFLAGVPAAAMLAAFVLILAVAQLPPLLILGPAAAYLFATSDSTMTCTLFAIWALIVSFSDSFLKPMLLGRGLEIPMPVILIGAIGGMLMSGIIGLFVGAVVLAIGYKMFLIWIKHSADA